MRTLLKNRLKNAIAETRFTIERKRQLGQLQISQIRNSKQKEDSRKNISESFKKMGKSMKRLRETYLMMEIENEDQETTPNLDHSAHNSPKQTTIYNTPDKKKRKHKKRSQFGALDPKIDSLKLIVEKYKHLGMNLRKFAKTAHTTNNLTLFDLQDHHWATNHSKSQGQLKKLKSRAQCSGQIDQESSSKFFSGHSSGISGLHRGRRHEGHTRDPGTIRGYHLDNQNEAFADDMVIPQSLRNERLRRGARLVKANKSCNCRASRCVKMYCECFKSGVQCGEHCGCQDCGNGKHFENERNPKAKGGEEYILERRSNNR